MHQSFLAARFLGTMTEERTAALDEGRELRIRRQIGSDQSLGPHHGRVVNVLQEILDAP